MVIQDNLKLVWTTKTIYSNTKTSLLDERYQKKNKFLRERFVQLSFAIKSSFWSAILYDVVLILHKWDHCRLYFHFVNHWCSGLQRQRHMLSSCNFPYWTGRAGQLSLLTYLPGWWLGEQNKMDPWYSSLRFVWYWVIKTPVCILCLTILNWGKWLGGLFYVSVCYFEGWPYTKPGKIH